MKILLTSLKISTLIGVVIGIIMCFIAWQHNSQCEIHCDGFIDWPYLFVLWASWFFVTFVAGGVCISLILYLFRLVRCDKS